MTQPTISAERIEEMLAGLEGVTPGEWSCTVDTMLEWPEAYVSAGGKLVALLREGELPSKRFAANARHIARCDPDTMREVLTLALSALRAQAQGSEAVAAAHIRGVLDEYERNTCTHETTHRGGSIWTICDECGRKWADDEGGFVPYSNPPKIAAALAFVASPPVQAQPQGVIEVLQEALHWITNIDNSAPVVRKLRAALATPPAPVDGWGDPQEIERVEADVKTMLAAPVDGGVTDEMVMRACQALDPFISLKEMRTALTAALTASRAAVAQDETP